MRRLREVGIDDPGVADRYPFQLSGGMRQRVGIAAALARDPEVLIADEPSTALDVTTQKEILGLLKSLQRARGMALILITHDLRVAFAMCDRIYVLYAGALLELGPSARIEDEPSHPYTLGLLLSEPPADHRLESLEAIAGSVPRGEDVADRCAFAARCRWREAQCEAGAPPLREVDSDVMSACIRLGEIRPEMRAYRRRQVAAMADAQLTRTGRRPCSRRRTSTRSSAELPRARSHALLPGYRSGLPQGRASGSSASRDRARRRWLDASWASRHRQRDGS